MVQRIRTKPDPLSVPPPPAPVPNPPYPNPIAAPQTRSQHPTRYPLTDSDSYPLPHLSHRLLEKPGSGLLSSPLLEVTGMGTSDGADGMQAIGRDGDGDGGWG